MEISGMHLNIRVGGGVTELWSYNSTLHGPARKGCWAVPLIRRNPPGGGGAHPGVSLGMGLPLSRYCALRTLVIQRHLVLSPRPGTASPRKFFSHHNGPC